MRRSRVVCSVRTGATRGWVTTSTQANSEDWDLTNPFETERILRDRLRGVRLVGELDLSHQHANYAMARSVVLGATRATGDYNRLHRYPAATAVFLAAEGAQIYDEGTFWPNLGLRSDRSPQQMRLEHDAESELGSTVDKRTLPALSPAEQSTIGRAFLNAVVTLHLEDFHGVGESERWLTYITPILLHGGIPATCANDAAALVLRSMREGLNEASELIEGLHRPHGPTHHLPKPLSRFLAYGGDFAVDLVQRMMTMALDAAAVGEDIARNSVDEMAEDAGLPHYLAEALLNGGSADLAVSRSRMLRPYIRIDPYSCHGPYITLPPVPGAADSSWVVTGGASSRIPASQHDSREVPLPPFREWTAALDKSDDSQTYFSGLRNAAAYVFDATGRLTRAQRHLKWPSALILVANEVQLLDEAGSPVPLAEELPPRAGAWTSWQLLRIDTTSTRAVTLTSPSPDTSEAVQVPVRRPAPTPIIAASPVPGVTGPDGCQVYSEPPLVKEADGTNASSWRVRWRSDQDDGPPPTALLSSLPEARGGRDLSPRLPDRAAFTGTVEIVGPLGSDMHERITVVRGLTVEAPDRVVGPDETVTATVAALCELMTTEGSASDRVPLSFGPGEDTAGLLADDVPLTFKIPRLAFALQRRDSPAAVIGWRRERIGLDEIESGEVETLVVRCGRPADVRLELRGGGERLQETPLLRASGDQGRWAFPLTQFRTTASNSGLATMTLTLHVDNTDAEIAVIQARHIVSDLAIDSLVEARSGQAVLQVTWAENRPFRNRQLRLWSQHRPWEAPVEIDIGEDARGYFDCLLETAPGPYIAEMAVRDDWSMPQRPPKGAENAAKVRIGTVADERARLARLRSNEPLEALEMLVSGHRRHTQLDGSSVVSVRHELAQALAACCEDSSSAHTFDGLVTLALSSEGLLAEMLVDDGWSLPAPAFRRLVLTLVPAVLDRPTTVASETLERLWRVAPIAGAALDYALEEGAATRWERFAGWVPGSDMNGPDQPVQPVTKPLDKFSQDRLRDLKAAIPPMESLPLQFGGYADAAFEMLERSWPDREQINRWRSAHTKICTHTQRLGPWQHRQIESLMPQAGSPGWQKFPADTLAAAFQLADQFSGDARQAASRALIESYELAPRLTERSVLVAIALRIADARPARHSGDV